MTGITYGRIHGIERATIGNGRTVWWGRLSALLTGRVAKKSNGLDAAVNGTSHLRSGRTEYMGRTVHRIVAGDLGRVLR